MKTPIQEAIETIKEYRDNGYADVDTCNTILLKLASMLEKEKEVMCEFADEFEYSCVMPHLGRIMPPEEFYNETFNTKER